MKLNFIYKRKVISFMKNLNLVSLFWKQDKEKAFVLSSTTFHTLGPLNRASKIP